MRAPALEKPAKVNRMVLDKLICDGGWMTIEALEMELGRTRDAVSRALYRYLQQGLVERRFRTYRINWRGGIPEWRAL